MSKRKHYIELIDEMDASHDNKYYLESSWYAHTVLEDRLVSALRQSGGATYANHRPIRMLGKKCRKLDKENKMIIY